MLCSGIQGPKRPDGAPGAMGIIESPDDQSINVETLKGRNNPVQGPAQAKTRVPEGQLYRGTLRQGYIFRALFKLH